MTAKLGQLALVLTAILLIIGFSPALAQENISNSAVNTEESQQIQNPDETDKEHLETTSESAASIEEPAEQKPPGVLEFLLTEKYLIFAVLMAAGLVLLFIKKINIWVRVGMLLAAFVLYGIDQFIPLHPSPMCAVTKLFMFKFTMGAFFPVFIALFLAIMLPSLIGRKLFCGWVCPLGALQELINKIPHKLKWKNFNFTAFNSVRFGLLIMFFLTFFLLRSQIHDLAAGAGANASEPIWTAYSAYSIYEPINYFEFLHWSVDITAIIMLSILFLGSLALYRPFCYLICPIGAITWLLEKIAPGRVRVDHNKCIQCGNCEEKAPCPTIKKMLDEKVKVLPDCTSCGECLGSCEEDAIKFSFKR